MWISEVGGHSSGCRKVVVSLSGVGREVVTRDAGMSY